MRPDPFLRAVYFRVSDQYEVAVANKLDGVAHKVVAPTVDNSINIYKKNNTLYLSNAGILAMDIKKPTRLLNISLILISFDFFIVTVQNTRRQ